MPTREAARRAAELRQQAKTNPAIAAVLRKRSKAAKKAAAARMASAATAADVSLATLAAEVATPDPPASRMRWTVAEADAMAAHALKVHPEGGVSRVQLLRTGMLALPPDRRKVVPDHLGGKSYTYFAKALVRVAKAAAAAPAPAPTPPGLTSRGKPRKTPEQLKALQVANAAKARAKAAEMRAAGTFPQYRRGPMRKPDPTANSLAGRIDRKLAEMGKKRADLQTFMGVSSTIISTLARNPPERQNLRPENMAKAAEYLGVTVEWLRDGDGKTTGEITPLIPNKTTVFKANGKHAPGMPMNADIAMAESHRSTINALFPLLPADVQAYIIARTAELIAMQASKR